MECVPLGLEVSDYFGLSADFPLVKVTNILIKRSTQQNRRVISGNGNLAKRIYTRTFLKVVYAQCELTENHARQGEKTANISNILFLNSFAIGTQTLQSDKSEKISLYMT